MSASPTTYREKVIFEPNSPQTVTMKYPEGKIVSGRFGEQVMFGLADNRVMFLDLGVAQKINILEPQPGESLCICKRWNGQKGAPATWDVWLTPATEQMRAAKHNPELQDQLRKSITNANEARYGGSLHGPISVPKKARPERVVEAPAPAQQQQPLQATHNTPNPTPNRGLVDEANHLVDAFAEVLARALTKHEGRVKPDEVRSLLLSAYIQRGKATSHA